METLIIYKLGSTKFTAQNDLHRKYESKHVAILIETKFENHECFHTSFTLAARHSDRQQPPLSADPPDLNVDSWSPLAGKNNTWPRMVDLDRVEPLSGLRRFQASLNWGGT